MAPASSMPGSINRHRSSRPRSMQACLSCRSRKVRCDVDSRGQPSQQIPRRRPGRLIRDASSQHQQSSCEDVDQVSQAALSATETLTVGAPDDDAPSIGLGLPFQLDTEIPWQRDQLETLDAAGSTDDGINGGTSSSSEPTWAEEHRLDGSNAGSIRPGKRRTDGKSMVLYSHYQYLSVGNMHIIPHEDVSYLEAQGCFHVPTRPTLDNFVERYFAHLHVLLPLLHEGDFWDMYSDKENSAPRQKISLLVFQAMLFASCNLLYELETESAPLPLAQAAILMMGWVPPSNNNLNPYKKWLGIAIQHARSINADRYAEGLEAPTLPCTAQNTVVSNRELQQSDQVMIEKSDALLKDWYARATVQFPPQQDSYERHTTKRPEDDKSVVLHTHLMYIYYHTASIALCNYRILRESISANHMNETRESASQITQLDRSCSELQESTVKVTRCFDVLTQRRLTRWLPISALSSLSKEFTFEPLANSNSISASNQGRLNILVEAMKAFMPQYYGAEWIKETARYVANLAQIDSQSRCHAGRESNTDWIQVLKSRPSSYLRMTWTVDLCISKGRLPEEYDFPAWLRGQLCLAKDPKPSLQVEKSWAPPPVESETLESALNYDMEQSLDLIPSLVDFLPSEQLQGSEDGDVEFLREPTAAAKFGVSDGQIRNRDMFTDEASCAIDLDGMEWTLFGVMQDSAEK
ncbi:hypothetical protein G7Z17_g902 [Cylindrodendrum hubeiense]|uniref:Transcription factor domain-containing protein n=1 Tax=Cylindrodendrum hubeiense TaxID=595255 RepID=A0A9P5HMF3_9HYPO|nr:hypothetical protein G7Z17_g902 [Cylindrodendrum hubeiense]